MSNNNQKIVPYLWYDGKAEEAANFYVQTFASVGAPASVGHVLRFPEENGELGESAMTVEFTLGDMQLIGLNGGPDFTFTPAISFFVACETEAEVDALYERLAEGGEVLMALDSYPFSERYAWINDRYGVSWQLVKGPRASKITPAFLFVREQAGKAEEAMNLYVSLFEDSAIGQISRYGPMAPDQAEFIAHAAFTLAGQPFIAMDSGLDHQFSFTEATSLFVHCKDQAEVDHFWNKLIDGGGEESMCGWLKDRYGVSWQIIPTRLMELVSDPDPERARRAVEAMLQMQKIDVATLEAAVRDVPAGQEATAV